MIGMTVARYSHRPRKSIPFCSHYLMPNPPSSGIKIHLLSFRELLNLSVLLEVGFALILNVVIQSHDNLFRIFDLGGPNRHKFLRRGP